MAKAKTTKKRTTKAAKARADARSGEPDLAKKLQFLEGFQLRDGTKVAARFKEIKSGMLLATALEKGLTRGDIRWHVQKGNLTLVD
jgi:hypothetical protein